MVEDMYFVVNVMFYLMSVMSPPPALCNLQPIGAHCCKVMYMGWFGFRVEHGLLNCDHVCKCVLNMQFELLEFVFDSVYVDLQHDDIFLTFTAGSVSLCCVCGYVVMWSCGRLWSVCEVVMVPYVDAVVDVTVMRVLLFVLFVLYVCLLRECDGVGLTAMLVWRMDEVWRLHGMWVVHVVQVLCLAQLTCCG